MTHQPVPSPASERGIALIVVLLLMAVMTGLATGFAMNSRVEVAMGENEVYYAGTRAAAEAGMNRAIEIVRHDHSHNLLAGPDGVLDGTNLSASTNTDNGLLGTDLITGTSPYALGTRYTYTIRVYDDDDPALYPTTTLSAQRLADMGEGVTGKYVDGNHKLILRVTGLGPNGTTVIVGRVLESTPTSSMSTVGNTLVVTNPALLVNGDLTINGTPHITGNNGSIQTNGNLRINGNSTTVSQDAFASGTLTVNNNWHAGHAQAGGKPTVTVPNINAADYLGIADYVLKSNGTIANAAGTTVANTFGWTFQAAQGQNPATWKITGNSPTSATYYVQTDVVVSGNPHAASGETHAMPLSIIATGNITVSGNAYFTPENSQHIQFVTNKDLKITGNINETSATGTMEGQSLVREQVDIAGNPNMNGQVIVQNVTSTSNTATSNSISGNPAIHYNGSFSGITTGSPGVPVTTTTYVNNVTGWIE